MTRRAVDRRERAAAQALLGVGGQATAEEIRLARRRLAKVLHPDTGGDPRMMRRVNEAADLLLRDGAPTAEPGAARPESVRPRERRIVSDTPSFVVEALPAEAFEALVLAAAELGEIVDDDPPYLLVTRLREPSACWCRLDLVPDAGSSTVSLALGIDDDDPDVAVDVVRDRWIAALNGLDWSAVLGAAGSSGAAPPPS